MKRRLSAFFLALVMVFTTVAATLGDATVFKADDLVIKLHYNRPDGIYTDWTVWLWAAYLKTQQLVMYLGHLEMMEL